MGIPHVDFSHVGDRATRIGNQNWLEFLHGYMKKWYLKFYVSFRRLIYLKSLFYRRLETRHVKNSRSRERPGVA